MPRQNFENIGVLQAYEYLDGVITDSPDSATDTCTVRVNGVLYPDTPIFYHCSDTAAERSNGAIEGAAAGFAQDDEIFVLKKRDNATSIAGIPDIAVYGHKAGIRVCSYIDLVLFRLWDWASSEWSYLFYDFAEGEIAQISDTDGSVISQPFLLSNVNGSLSQIYDRNGLDDNGSEQTATAASHSSYSDYWTSDDPYSCLNQTSHWRPPYCYPYKVITPAVYPWSPVNGDTGVYCTAWTISKYQGRNNHYSYDGDVVKTFAEVSENLWYAVCGTPGEEIIEDGDDYANGVTLFDLSTDTWVDRGMPLALYTYNTLWTLENGNVIYDQYLTSFGIPPGSSELIISTGGEIPSRDSGHPPSIFTSGNLALLCDIYNFRYTWSGSDHAAIGGTYSLQTKEDEAKYDWDEFAAAPSITDEALYLLFGSSKAAHEAQISNDPGGDFENFGVQAYKLLESK